MLQKVLQNKKVVILLLDSFLGCISDEDEYTKGSRTFNGYFGCVLRRV